MSKRFQPRNILTISDVHLGHPLVSMTHILQNLERFFDGFASANTFPDLKVIFIAGDLWHQVLPLEHNGLTDFFVFWYKFCSWCQRKQVTLRLMKGTPSHDGTQGDIVETYTVTTFPALDFRYVRDLSIEVLDTLKLSVLYVPDECRPSAEQIYEDTIAVFHQHQLQQVDIGIMHGMFHYQLGTIPTNHKVHTEALYQALVRRFISIGHIHIASRFERIFAQGSFDRISHGEEGDKGAYYFVEVEKDTWEPHFLVNRFAKCFKSITILNSTPDPMEKVEQLLLTLPDDSHVRIIAEEGHDILRSVDFFAKKYPLLHFKRKLLKAKDKEAFTAAMPAYVAIVLTKETLTQAILEDIQSRQPLDSRDYHALKDELNHLHS